MESPAALDDADALARGRAFVVLAELAGVDVGGADASAWLQDLLTADLDAVPVDGARRTLLLRPTGRIRADLWAIRRSDGIELLEPADASASIASLLAPYVLSSDVAVSPPRPVAVVVVPGADERTAAVLAEGAGRTSSPSLLGTGIDVVIEPGAVEAARAVATEAGLREVPAAAAEDLRVRRGIPRWRVDVEPDAFPVGARLDDAVAPAKGCFLGQEAVARIRNLGHPPAVLVHVAVPPGAASGDDVIVDGSVVGTLTSVAREPAGSAVGLARIRWAARDARLTLADGSAVHPIAAAGGDRVDRGHGADGTGRTD